MTWNDARSVGEALTGAYPTANYMTVSREDLVRLVLALPGFSDSPDRPGEPALAAIMAAWIAAAEGPDDASPDEGWA